MNSDKKNWYVVYTKPRWEKKVFSRLGESGMECYCPLNRVRKTWSDRLKWVDEPLFKSYVFVKVMEEDLPSVRWVDGVVNFVYWLGKPAIIRDTEIEKIRKFLNDYRDVIAVPLELPADSRITVLRGALMDKQGTVIRSVGKKVQIRIESIGYSLVAYVDKSNVVISKTK